MANLMAILRLKRFENFWQKKEKNLQKLIENNKMWKRSDEKKLDLKL